MVDLHRHDEFSTFDGFGKARELAELAKELGHTSLGTSNHGNTNGLVKTYEACKDAGIKPILGVEGYFIPKYKPQTRGWHLCLFAKDLEGYGNINTLQYLGEQQKYYNPIWDFDMLAEHTKGVICTSACVASYSSQCILNGDIDKAKKYFKKMVKLFGEDFYIEIQPYKISDPGVQEKLNVKLIEIADEMGIKCILTSDSHRGRKEDLPSYLKMHEIAGHNKMDIKGTYADRYMPTEKEIMVRFVEMHAEDFGEKKAKRMAKEMVANLEEIESKVGDNILDALPLELPKLEGEDSYSILLRDVKQGLKDRGKYNKQYVTRCKEELEVIKYHGFSDYFLIVADYVKWAKAQGIAVGPGRGSVCNSLVAYALKITEVDSLLFELDFRRFLRKDKKKFPDIDLDFETSRRAEVLEYLVKKYDGHAARICSYGLYKVDNLVNDLAKVCGLDTSKDMDDEQRKVNKAEIESIKNLINSYVNNKEDLYSNLSGLDKDPMAEYYNKRYDGIITHFTKLYEKVRFIGTHAAGVAITGGNLLDYVAIKIDKEGNIFTNYDLQDLEGLNVIKFDILGLKTMESIGELRKTTGVVVNYDEVVNDKALMEQFGLGNCDGVFQFDAKAARGILMDIKADCFSDVVAASSMNRPGPLIAHIPQIYAANKFDSEEAKLSIFYKYTEESYGTIIYQEQLQHICINIGGLTWGDADKVMKMMKSQKNSSGLVGKSKELYNKDEYELEEKFTHGAMEHGMTEEDARSLFEKVIAYTFNKGHALGYSLISMEEMYYKVYFPNHYWFAKLKYAKDEAEYTKFCCKAAKDGAVIFLPHVNYSRPSAAIRKIEGEAVIQQGLSEIKNVGAKAAQYIWDERKANGIFTSYDNFYDRCKSRVVTSRVIDTLQEYGALDFDKKLYIKKVKHYNGALYSRADKIVK